MASYPIIDKLAMLSVVTLLILVSSPLITASPFVDLIDPKGEEIPQHQTTKQDLFTASTLPGKASQNDRISANEEWTSEVMTEKQMKPLLLAELEDQEATANSNGSMATRKLIRTKRIRRAIMPGPEDNNTFAHLPSSTEERTASEENKEINIDTLFDPPSTSTIKPGSRPSARSDNDPTVCCVYNPYQERCAEFRKKWRQPAHNISYSSDNVTWTAFHFKPSSCLDFYNQSDNHLLWWQALQKEANFTPSLCEMHIENKNECADEPLINFYISDRADSLKKYVELQRGARLRKNTPSEPTILHVCYLSHQPHLSDEYYMNAVAAFLNCLLYYGN